MCPMPIDLRQARAVVVIAGSVVAVVIASFAYLRPPATAHSSLASGPAVQHPQSFPMQRPTVSGDTVGSYFVWVMPGAGSGGHAP